MKKIITASITIIVLFFIAGCGANNSSTDPQDGNLLSFDKENAKTFEVDTLTCYYPNEGWELYEEKDNMCRLKYTPANDTDTQEASKPVIYYYVTKENTGDFDKAFDAFITDRGVPEESVDKSFIEADIEGCDKAIRYEYALDEGSMYGYFVKCDDTEFSFDVMYWDGYYYPELFDKLISSCDFENYASATLCSADNCSNETLENHKYCEEHECVLEGCTEEKMNDGDYCPKHWLSKYDGTDEVPDFGELFEDSDAFYFDEEASQKLMNALDGNAVIAKVYYGDESISLLVGQYVDLLKAKGFFKYESKDDATTYVNNKNVVVISLTDCTSKEKGEKVFMITVIETP